MVHYPINQNLDAIPDDFKEEQIFWLDNWLKLLGDEPDFGHMNPLSNEEIEIFVTWKQKRDSAEEAKVILGASKYNDNYSKQFYERTIELDNIRDESIYDVDPRFKEIMKVGRHQNYTLSQPEGIGDPHSYEG